MDINQVSQGLNQTREKTMSLSTTFLRVSAATILGAAAFLWSGQLPSASTSSLVSMASAQNAGSAPKGAADSAKKAAAPAADAKSAAKGAPVCKEESDEYGNSKQVCR